MTLEFGHFAGFCTLCTLVAANLGSLGFAASAELLKGLFNLALDVLLTDFARSASALWSTWATLTGTTLTSGAALATWAALVASLTGSADTCSAGGRATSA